MIKRNLILFLLLVLFSRIAHAQFEQFYESWRWAHFTTESGLPSDVVEDVIETDDGIPWVTSPKGIAWYDGYRWNPITVDSTKPNQRPRSILTFSGSKILVIQDGKLYIGNTKGFKRILFNNQNKNGIISSVATIDSTTILCVYETEDSAYVLKVNDNDIYKLISPPPGKLYQSLTTLWFSSGIDLGLYRFSNNEWKKLFNPIGDPIAIRNIVENVNGEGIIAIDAPKNKIGLWEFKNKNQVFLSRTERNQPVRTVGIANNGEAIVIYESGDIHLRIDNSWKPLDPIPRQMTSIVSIKYRQNNDLWVTTDHGLYLFRRHLNLSKKTNYVFSDRRNIVLEVFQSKENEIWIGSMYGLEIQKPNGDVKYYSAILNVPLGLVTGINQDRHGNIWVCAGGGAKGIFEWDGKKWRRHFEDEINFHKIRKDQKGDLWFLGLGVKKSDPAGYYRKNKTFYRIDSIINLPSNRIYSFAESKIGTLWIGTSEGLVKKNKNTTKYWGHESFGKNAKIFTLAVDSVDNIWFSTFSSFLGVITQNDSIKWVWKREEQHEYNEKIWDLAFDEVGVLWVGSTKGLFKYFNNTWSNFGSITGTMIKELRVLLPTKEKIFVGGHGTGLRTIQNRSEIYPIKTFISKPIVDNDEAYCAWSPSAFWGQIPSGEIETRYRLNSNDWSEWSKQNIVNLKGLQSGSYTIKVQAKDQHGRIFDGLITQSFVVMPPIYFQPIFYTPIITLCLIIIVISIQSYYAKQQFKISLQDQRIRISNDLHDEVGSNLGSISLISQRLKRNRSISAEVKNELALIADTAFVTANELRDIVWYINPQNDNINSIAIRIKETAEKHLRGFDIQFTLHNDPTNENYFVSFRHDLMLMFKEILHNIAKHSKATKVTITFEHRQDVIRLVITDNGIGFDPESEYSGAGMRSMKRRAENLKADLSIDSVRDRGTTISILIKKS